jgi:hypothetical protein
MSTLNLNDLLIAAKAKAWVQEMQLNYSIMEKTAAIHAIIKLLFSEAELQADITSLTKGLTSPEVIRSPIHKEAAEAFLTISELLLALVQAKGPPKSEKLKF